MFVYWDTQWTPLIWDSVSVFLPKAILTDECLATTAKFNSIDFLQIYSRQTQSEIAELSFILNRFEDEQLFTHALSILMHNFHNCSLTHQLRWGSRKYYICRWSDKFKLSSFLTSTKQLPLDSSLVFASTTVQFSKLRASRFYLLLLSRFH